MNTQTQIDYFQVKLGQYQCLLELEQIGEVLNISKGDICSIPGVKSCVMGVINQRGKLLWIIDLIQLLQLNSVEEKRRTKPTLTIMIVNRGDKRAGFLVSSLQEIVSLTSEEIDFIQGDVNNNKQQEQLIILDIDKIFTELETALFV